MLTLLTRGEKTGGDGRLVAPSPEQEVDAMTPLTTPSGREIARECLAHKAADVQPTGATIPRPWEEYRLEGEFTDHGALIEAVQDALEDVTLTPQRYAELMWLLDNWFVEERDGSRRDTIARSEKLRGRLSLRPPDHHTSGPGHHARGRCCAWGCVASMWWPGPVIRGIAAHGGAVAIRAFPKTQTRPRAGSVRVEFRSLGWLRENAS